ncbi:MAG: ATP-binding protein, partial [Ktedonobacterales bacterium]
MEAQSIAPVAVAISPSFGAMLKRYRRASGLTQESLAERAGYSVGHISKLESSVRQPVPATVELLAEALELSPAERSAFERAARRIAAPSRGLALAHIQAVPPFTGRSQEETCIEQYLEGETEPPLLLFAGEPGIGKSRLLDATFARGTSEGWFVTEGTCRRRGTQGPYGPLLEALTDAVHQIEPTQLRSALDGCSWLVRLIPELAEMRAVPMPAWSLPANQERRLMFSAVERFLGNIAGPSGALLLLDNLQWAGADTLDLLSALVEAAPRSLLRIIGTYRHNEVRPGDPLAVLMADLAHEGQIVRETIEPLSPSAAAKLLDVLLAGMVDVDVETRTEVLRKAAGVPFVLVSYAQWLRTKASQEKNGSNELGIPWNVEQTVVQRVAALPEAAQAIIRIAAVADRDGSFSLLTRVAQRYGYSEMDVVQAIDAACAAGLLVQRGDDSYALAYDLTQEVVERTMGTAQRAYLHRAIAEVLDGERKRPQVEAMADHYIQAGDPEKALRYIERAGAKAKALHAYADAEYFYRSLAERFEERGQTKEAAHAHELLGTTLGFMGRFEEALQELERALEGYRLGGGWDAQARVVAQIGNVYYAQGEIERGIARLEQEVTTAV